MLALLGPILAKCHVYSQFYVRLLDLCSACLVVLQCQQIMHDTLHWLSFPQRVTFKLCLLTYN